MTKCKKCKKELDYFDIDFAEVINRRKGALCYDCHLEDLKTKGKQIEDVGKDIDELLEEYKNV